MTTEAIFEKYWAALTAVEAVMVPADTAIALALRLAIGDAYAEGSALVDDLAAIVASQAQPTPDQRQQESLQAQISRINDWLQNCEPGLYISPGDTADAVLAALGIRDRRIAELHADMESADEEVASARQELVMLIAERDGLRQQLAQMDADNADLLNKVHQAQVEIDRLTRQNVIAVGTLNSLTEAHRNGNGNGVDPTPTPEWNRNHPAWDGLSDEQRVMVYQLTKGELRFRQISKEDRIDLVGRVLRHLADAGEPVTGPQFDRLKPTWMPTAGAVVLLADSRKWQDLLGMVKAPA